MLVFLIVFTTLPLDTVTVVWTALAVALMLLLILIPFIAINTSFSIYCYLPISEQAYLSTPVYRKQKQKSTTFSGFVKNDIKILPSKGEKSKWD
jgi:hypothetical protein